MFDENDGIDVQLNESNAKFVVYLSTFSGWFHTWSRVHCVAKQTVSWHRVSNHSCTPQHHIAEYHQVRAVSLYTVNQKKTHGHFCTFVHNHLH